MQLDARQTVILAIITLFLGRLLIKKVALFGRYNIPEPVIGGLVVASILSIVYLLTGFEFGFDLFVRDSLLIVFFTCIGLSAKVEDLIKGGRSMLVLLLLMSVFLIIQDIVGVSFARIFDFDIYTGLLGGSISLSGGHGTAIAWGNIFEVENDFDNAIEIGVAGATFGLVMGGILGGPIARFLIKRFDLRSTSKRKISVGVKEEQIDPITPDTVFKDMLTIAIAVGIGINLNRLLVHWDIHMPAFVSCLFGGIVLTNTFPFIFKKAYWPTGKPTLALISDISLGLFLSISLISLRLWTLVDLPLPFFIMLLVQVALVVIFSIFVIFYFMGRNYDASVIASGFAGLTLGATPTAIVNMTAVTKKYGASPRAFIIIPLVGAFFIDIVNSIIIQTFLKFFT